jgi:hypothetical protein
VSGLPVPGGRQGEGHRLAGDYGGCAALARGAHGVAQPGRFRPVPRRGVELARGCFQTAHIPFMLKLSRRVRAALGHSREEAWEGCDTLRTCQVAEGLIQLTGLTAARRVIFARTLLGVIRGPGDAKIWDRHKHEFAVHVTNLPTCCNALQIEAPYHQRADTENAFVEVKNQWGFSGLAAKSRATT